MTDDGLRRVRLLNEAEAAERLGIPKTALARLRKEGRIKYVPLTTKMVRYREEDLAAFYDDNAVTASPPPDKPANLRSELAVIRAGWRLDRKT